MLWPRTVSTEAEPPNHVGRRAMTQNATMAAKRAIDSIRRHGGLEREGRRESLADGGSIVGGAATAAGCAGRRRRGRAARLTVVTSVGSTSITRRRRDRASRLTVVTSVGATSINASASTIASASTVAEALPSGGGGSVSNQLVEGTLRIMVGR